MAQSNYTPILIYGSTTSTNTPLAANLTTSASGVELAINAADGKLFYKDSGGVVQVLATKGTGPIGGSNTQVQYNSSGALAGSANLTFNGTTLTANTLNLTNALGTAYGGTGLTSFTANGVVYASSSSALTTGSALVFDGTNLGVGGSPSELLTIGNASGVKNALIKSTDNNVALKLAPGNGATSGLRFNNSAGTQHWNIFQTVGASGQQGNLGIYNEVGAYTALTLDTSGNLGLGVTPSGWTAGRTALQISGSSTAVYFAGATTNTIFANNYYYSLGDKFNTASGYAQMYQQQSGGVHAWFTSSAASVSAGSSAIMNQYMTLDASGRLGVGETSPTQKLTLVSNTGTYGTAYQPIFQIGNASSGGTVSANTGLGAIVWSTDGTLTSVASIEAVRENPGSGAASALAFRTGSSGGGTERARIDSSGNLLVGTTSATGTPSSGFSLLKDFSAGSASGLAIGHISGTGSGAVYEQYSYNSTAIGSITQSGTTAVAYNTSSDYRLKNSIAPMTGALAKVALLKPCTYKWNADGSDGEGFIAHELAEVCPHAVTGEKDAVDEEGNPKYQGIDTSFLVATLTAAIQEQQSIIQQLTDRITILEGK